jgi:NAD(P)-dependent dehydrogenase (short-subunit alcohol dehydrogenase family)
MVVNGSVALVTGANRGIGRAFVKVLLRQNARKIYACARNPIELKDTIALAPDRIIPVKLDITQEAEIADAARQCPDVSLLVNNAGVTGSDLASIGEDMSVARHAMEVNYFANLNMCRHFIPGMVEAKSGAIVNILSIAALFNVPSAASYSASKAALYMLCQSLRVELADKGIRVTMVYPGFVETRMAESFPYPKVKPELIAERALENVGKNIAHTFPDHFSQLGEQSLLNSPREVLEDPQMVINKITEQFVMSPHAGA